MSGPGGILALDISTRTGWAYGGTKDTPIFGLWLLRGGVNALGECWASLANQIEDACRLHRPSQLVFAAPLAKQQTTARLLIGLASHAESEAWRQSVRALEVREDTARKAILGRGWFAGNEVSRSRSAATKAAGLAWCKGKGWLTYDDNVSDALVVWEYARRLALANKQWSSPS